jgi:two-component system LytT family sensor kinase
MDDIHDKTQIWLSPDSGRYWTYQILGWSAFTILSFLSLTLWYNPGELVPALHTLLQSILGLAVSHPLRFILRNYWSAPLRIRGAVIGLGVLGASLIWTLLRIETFELLTGEIVPPSDYGGWLFASVIVFASWTLCYPAAKYYRQSLEQRERINAAERDALRAVARANEEMVKRLTAESLYQEARLRMLKYQLNPHFLFNALNSVSFLVKRGKSEDATAMLARIADFLRATLEHDEELQHSLDREVELVSLYLSIEKIRFGDRLIAEFHIEPSVREEPVPSFLLQPLIENAMKYAVGRSLSPATLTVAGWRSGGFLHLKVADTGATLRSSDTEAKTASLGIGLRNVEQRLRSAYGENFKLDIEDNVPSGLVVKIAFPLAAANPPSAPPDERKIAAGLPQ